MGIKARHITLVLAIPMAALIAFYFDPAKKLSGMDETRSSWDLNTIISKPCETLANS